MTESIFSNIMQADAERKAITQQVTAKRRELEAAGKTPKQIQNNKELKDLQAQLETAKSAAGLLTTQESLNILNRQSTESAINRALRQAQNEAQANVIGITTKQRKELFNEANPPSFPGGTNGKWVWTGSAWGWKSNTTGVVSPVDKDAIGDGSIITPSQITGTGGNPNDVNNNGIPDNLEAAQLQIDAQARAAAQLREFQLQEAAARGKAAIDLLKETIKQYFTMSGDDRFVNDLSSIIDNYVKEGYDAATISVMLPQTQPYKIRFAGNEARIKAGLSALSPANYLQAEDTYNDILKRYNLGDIGTRETFAALIGGQVSADELADRVVNVYDRIRNADPALRAEMNRVEDLSRGQLTDADFAKALLTGDKGAAQLKRKIATAEIAAEARIRSEQLQRQGFAPGLTVDTAEDLQKLGVTREQARAGFEQIALTQPRLTQLAEMYTGETPEATGLQRELEAEQFQGMQSQRRRRLAEQETASFLGQSGTASGISLGRRRTGQI